MTAEAAPAAVTGLDPIERAIADIAAGRAVVVVDDEDRENEGDVVFAAELATPELVAFTMTQCRGLLCVPLEGDVLDHLELGQMAAHNTERMQTAFTVSVDAREGTTTGISAADRARTITLLADPTTNSYDLVRPGHVFPLRAKPGGVLRRPGHTEAAVDLARLAGLRPAGVICEIVREDGTMARLPDLRVFARQHELKIGTIADLIGYRSRNETLIERSGARVLATPHGEFDCVAYRDKGGGVHLALTHGVFGEHDDVLVRVHEPFTALDLLDTASAGHSWPLHAALAALHRAPAGVAVLLNCGHDAALLLPQLLPDNAAPAPRAAMDLRTYGVGAQILRDLGVRRMQLLGSPRRMPSMAGYGLEVMGFRAAA